MQMICPRCGELAQPPLHWAPGGWVEPDFNRPCVCRACGWSSQGPVPQMVADLQQLRTGTESGRERPRAERKAAPYPSPGL
jgi:hypothetical protein